MSERYEFRADPQMAAVLAMLERRIYAIESHIARRVWRNEWLALTGEWWP